MLESIGTGFGTFIFEQVDCWIASVVINENDKVAASTFAWVIEWTAKVRVDELEWGTGMLNWNSDDLASVLGLDADIALLVVMGITLKERLHCRWMEVGHALVPELRFSDRDGRRNGGSERGACPDLADKVDPSNPAAGYSRCG